MKYLALGIIFVILVAGCTIPSLPLFPTNTPVPPATIIPPAVTTPTRAAIPSAAAPSALTVREHFLLRDLPGIGRHPYAIASLGDKIYTLNTETENLAVIQNDRVTKFIPVGKKPAALAADPLQKRLYVGSRSDKTISLVINDQVTLTQNVGEEPSVVLFQENRLIVGMDMKPIILVLDPTTLQTQARITIPNAFGIINLAGDSARHRIYVGMYEKIAVIDSTTWQIQTILATKGSYYTLVAHPPNDSILVAIYESATNSQYLTIFDAVSGAARGRVKIGHDPHGALVNADGSRLYVANSFTNNVSVIDPRNLTEVATISVGLRPYALALDETARRLYVANSDSDSISVIDAQTNQVIATIPMGMLLTCLTTNESTGRVYVASASTDSVFVIEGTHLVKEISVGRHPIDLARDAQNNRVLVADVADGTLTIIDESNLTARVTQPITRALSTVAVDNARSRLFAGSAILDLTTLAPIGQLTMRGNTIGSVISPELVRLNSNTNRIYTLGGNGTPGSNARRVTYSIDGNTLQQRAMLPYYGNHDHIAIDPKTNRIFVAGTHPLALTNELSAFDVNDTKVYSLTLFARTAGMVFNPETNHLFLSQITGYSRGDYGPTPVPADNTILVLDTNSFGEVARLVVNTPGKMARLGNTIYVANREDGSITLIQDADVPTPPSPTPTFTPTPYLTRTPGSPPPIVIMTSSPARTTPAPRATLAPPATPTPPVCAIPLSSTRSWTAEIATRLGCPIEAERAVNYASQRFERGAMYWREDLRRIVVLYADQTWVSFDDTWNSALPEDSCPSITVASGQNKPKRGFGKVWCEQAGVLAKLGAGVSAEVGTYAATIQTFERGQMFVGIDPSKVFVLYTDGKWE